MPMLKNFATRDDAERYFYNHADGEKYRNAMDESRKIDREYNQKFQKEWDESCSKRTSKRKGR